MNNLVNKMAILLFWAICLLCSINQVKAVDITQNWKYMWSSQLVEANDKSLKQHQWHDKVNNGFFPKFENEFLYLKRDLPPLTNGPRMIKFKVRSSFRFYCNENLIDQYGDLLNDLPHSLGNFNYTISIPENVSCERAMFIVSAFSHLSAKGLSGPIIYDHASVIVKDLYLKEGRNFFEAMFFFSCSLAFVLFFLFRNEKNNLALAISAMCFLDAAWSLSDLHTFYRRDLLPGTDFFWNHLRYYCAQLDKIPLLISCFYLVSPSMRKWIRAITVAVTLVCLFIVLSSWFEYMSIDILYREFKVFKQPLLLISLMTLILNFKELKAIEKFLSSALIVRVGLELWGAVSYMPAFYANPICEFYRSSLLLRSNNLGVVYGYFIYYYYFINTIRGVFLKERKMLKKIMQQNLSLKETNQYLLKIQKITEREQKSKSIIAMARQLLHDISSPAAAIKILAKSFDDQSEKVMSLRNLSDRIQDIVSSYFYPIQNFDSNSASNQEKSLCNIIEVAESILSEKRIQFNNKENLQLNLLNKTKESDLFVEVEDGVLHRILSNTINNSLEVINYNGKVEVILSYDKENNTICLDIMDSGEGFDQDFINCFDDPYSNFKTKKSEHTGKSLFYAKRYLNSWDGELTIRQKNNTQPTCVRLTIPRQKTPSWFGQQLNLKGIEQIIIIDDFRPFHYFWKERVKKLKLKFQSFYSLDEAQQFINQQRKTELFKKTLFLVDYHFGDSEENGINFITKNDLFNRSVLVTSYYKEKFVQSWAQEHQVLLFSKNSIDSISLN